MAFFKVRDGRFVPDYPAVSWWSPQQVNGVAACALIARQLETHDPGPAFTPARLTVEFLMPVLNEPIALESHIVREGNRVVVADASIVQHGEIRARATLSYLAVSEQPPGEIWAPDEQPPVPMVRLTDPEGNVPQFKTGDSGWSPDFAAAQNADRKHVWQNFPPVVEGEAMSPLQRVAALGDSTNMVCNWGSAGVGYINSDMTVTLARLPEGNEVGLQAQDHVAAAGVAVGTATMYDRSGRIGTTIVTCVANARRQIDMASAAAAAADAGTLAP
ncbi:acyl-CoA thioesterase domain-containing protein [Nocardia stercoris]|uniref:Thioesterase family protein n=1 Tax=Nocardia stercoris TaxID=2483361 RepID=A0A3M2L987_9NOCA|nr:acyl-CoA thioesterase domain-containing protein [Nocardia stercoris]RMI33984.1 thioesterase family protein [Nocardia stercoris]